MNRIRTTGYYALPITLAMLLTLGTHCAEPPAADYTVRLIDRANHPLKASSGKRVVNKSARPKGSRPSVFVRVRGQEKLPTPSKPTVVTALRNLPPKTPQKRAEPILYVPPFMQPGAVPFAKPASRQPGDEQPHGLPRRFKQPNVAPVTRSAARPGVKHPEVPAAKTTSRAKTDRDVPKVATRVARRYDDEQPSMPAETVEAPADVLGETRGEGVLSHSALAGRGGCPYFPTQSGAKTICGIDCSNCRAPYDSKWRDARPIPWSIFGQGEYVGPPRTEHTFQYFLRVNDELEIVYFLSREKTSQPYQFAVADKIRVESLTDATVNREVEIQPDGFIALPQIGEVLAAGKTVKELRDTVQQLYTTVQRNPQITITPVLFNVVLQDIVNAVDRRAGIGGQSQPVRVTPEGTLQVPGLRSIYVQGLTLDELKRELEVRYRASYGPGLNITPILIKRAPTYVFVGGEVRSPGRYSLEGPTTVMQAIALAGGWNVGGNTNQVVVFRRDDNWCLKATKINLFRPLYGKDPCPVNDVWIRDNDLVIVPKRPILVADDIIELYMTRGVYSAFPVNFFYNLRQGSVLAGSP